MSTHGQFNTKSPTIKRILREAAELSTTPSADYHAAPLESNLFEWHFTLRGPPAPSPFASGLYHGRIVLPPTYPLRPPSFRFLTPSGRFEPNREICLSISGHHEESWQPAWGIRTALVAIRSFMDTEAKGQLGGIEAGDQTRKALAGTSGEWRCNGCGGRTNKEIMKEREDEVKKAEEEGTAKKEEETVPDELRLGYRDELGKGQGKETQTEEGKTASAVPPPTEPRIPSATLPHNTEMPTPTATTFSPSAHQQQPQPHQPSQNQALPAIRPPQQQNLQQQQLLQTQAQSSTWLDLAILGIGVALGIMVIRKLVTIIG